MFDSLQVSSIGQQLSVSQRQISDLDARNQQLRAFLDADLKQQATVGIPSIPSIPSILS